MTVFFDKEETHRLCEELGVSHTPAARLAAGDTVDSLISRFGLPVVLKPRRSFWADTGKAREDVMIAVDREQLASALANIGDRTRYLVEGYFSGNGTGVSVLCDNGTVLQAFQHRRLREGWGGCSSYRISEAVHPELRQAVERICQRTAHTGVCMFEFRVNPETGKWILLEINARFWGSMALPLALGLDYPSWLHELMVTGRRVEPQAYRAGVRSRNLLLDANNLRKRLMQGGFSGLGNWLVEAMDFLVQPLRWATGRETPDSLALDDPAPAVREIWSVFRRPTRPTAEPATPAGIETSIS
jgi:predicted ATP-grasp superfamily ATP-dependent carboligase